MNISRSILSPALLLSGVFMLSCSEEKPGVRITQHTDPSHITAIVEYNGEIFCATKGGLVRWDLSADKYEILTTADGLPSNNLSDIHVDSGNRLWVGTDVGVGIFDGVSWERYGIPDGLPSVEITDLSIDNNGTMWVATVKGMARFNSGRFEVINEDKGPVDLHTNCIYFDKGENIWVGTADKGVFIKIKDVWRRTGSKNGLLTDAANSIVQTWDNSIWASSWAGISRWDGYGWKVFKSMKKLGTFKARQLLSSKDRLWFFSANGVHSSRGSEWLHYTEDEGLISNDVTCGYLVSDDLVYVGTAYGMSVIKNGTIENYVVPNKQFGNNCISLAVDDKNRIWVGTWETGLNLYDSGYWCAIMGQDEKMLATVRNLIFTPGGEIVFNTKDGILIKNQKSWETHTRHNGVAGNDIRCGVYDPGGVYWVGTSTGISSFSNGRWKRYRAIHGLPSENIWACALDSEGTVWFCSSDGIISIADNMITDRTPEIEIDDTDFRSVEVIGKTVYFGAESGKIITYDSGEWNVYGNKFLNTDKGIYSITAGPSGVLWFATNGDGVIRLENNKTNSYTVSDGLPSNFVRSVAYSDGILWAACYGGVGEIEVDFR